MAKNFNFSILSLHPEIKIELGAGTRRLPGWISIDMNETADIKCNLVKEKLPFDDNTVTEIYHSHFLEHFSFPEPMCFVLSECYRVLVPGGLMRVAVPDASIYVRSYIKGEPTPEVIPFYQPAFFYNSPIDSINYIAYMAGEHKHCFDLENLMSILQRCSFCQIAQRPFDPEIDIEKRKQQSIYVKCNKPKV